MLVQQSVRVGCLALAIFAVWNGAAFGGQELSDAERDGYLIWLHALEATIASREAADLPETRPLYPRDPEHDGETLAASMADVARALAEIEARPRLLQEPGSRSPLHALNRARNHAHLAEYDSALVWYAVVAQRDTLGEFAIDLGRETMAAAVAAGADQVVRQRLTALRRAADTGARELELEIGLRFLIARADTASLTALVDQLGASDAAWSGRLRYWQAFSLSWLGRWSASLAVLRGMVVSDGLSHGLDERQRAWVLAAIPDQMLLSGRRHEATPLYRALAASSIPEVALWAACQAAASDLLDGHFLKAGTALEGLCSRQDNAVWRQYACQLARLSDELQRLQAEGRPHGAAVYYEP